MRQTKPLLEAINNDVCRPFVFVVSVDDMDGDSESTAALMSAAEFLKRELFPLRQHDSSLHVCVLVGCTGVDGRLECKWKAGEQKNKTK